MDHDWKDVSRRLKAARLHLGLSQTDMARRLAITLATYGRYERAEREPPTDVLLKVVDMGIGPSWLLTGSGTMATTAEPDSVPTGGGFDEPARRGLEPVELDGKGFVLIPRYDVKAAAGGGAVVQDEGRMGSLAFQRKFLHSVLRANPADLVVIEAKGDSMSGVVDDGDVILIETSEPKLRGSGIYVFLVDDILLVKHLRVRLDGSIEVYGSDPETIPPEVISRDDLKRVRIIGRVIWRAGKA